MDGNVILVVFEVDGQRFALPLASVVRVVRAVEITALPHAPAVICGAIDVQGQVLPVVNLRQRLGLRQKDLDVNDEFLIVQTETRVMALWVDSVSAVIERSPQTLTAAEQVVPGRPDFTAAIRLADGLLLVHEPARLLADDPPGTSEGRQDTAEAEA